ncbi:uncharacterized protein [Ptychodera flava]|uniref:uncharacterized protein n=1 Tax=Ptychodera flava TaxID=63121 RepID=UPI00396A48BC
MGYAVTPTAIDNKVKQLSAAVDQETEHLLGAWTSNVAELKISKALIEALEGGPLILTKPIIQSLSTTTLYEVAISGPAATNISTLVTLIESGFPVNEFLSVSGVISSYTL